MDALSTAILAVLAALGAAIVAGVQTLRLGVVQERERRLVQEVRDLTERISKE